MRLMPRPAAVSFTDDRPVLMRDKRLPLFSALLRCDDMASIDASIIGLSATPRASLRRPPRRLARRR